MLVAPDVESLSLLPLFEGMSHFAGKVGATRERCSQFFTAKTQNITTSNTSQLLFLTQGRRVFSQHKMKTLKHETLRDHFSGRDVVDRRQGPRLTAPMAK